MQMPMMNIGEMGVFVAHGGVCVGMLVRLAVVPGERVRVLVVGIMTVLMRVFERLVAVLVLVPFAEVQPDADGHQRCGQPKRWPC